MAEYTIDKIEYGSDIYKLQDNISGYITSPNIPYLTCGTDAGTVAKTTTLVTGTLPATLTTGTRVAVRFTNSNTASNPTITIGSYGAIAIKRYGTTAPSTSAATSWNAGNVITLVYDGTYWLMADWTSPNTTYSEISEANITSGTGSTTGLVTGRRAKAAVNAFAPVKDVTVNDTSVLNGTTAAITVPTKTSQLTNDGDGTSNFATMADISGLGGGTITGVKTTAGAHTTIDVSSGNANFNVPTNTSHLINDSGFLTAVPASGVTAGTYTGGFSSKIFGIYLPSFTIDNTGRVTSATNLSTFIPELTNSNANYYANMIGGNTWSLALREMTSGIYTLTAGETSTTQTISADSGGYYSYKEWVRVIDVKAWDYITYEPVIVDWVTSDWNSRGSGYSITLTVSIKEAHNHNIVYLPILSYGNNSM